MWSAYHEVRNQSDIGCHGVARWDIEREVGDKVITHCEEMGKRVEIGDPAEMVEGEEEPGWLRGTEQMVQPEDPIVVEVDSANIQPLDAIQGETEEVKGSEVAGQAAEGRPPKRLADEEVLSSHVAHLRQSEVGVEA